MFRMNIYKHLAYRIYFNNAVLQTSHNLVSVLQPISHYTYVKSYYQDSTASKIKPAIARNTPQQNTLTEQEYLVRLKNDPDVFGGPAETEVSDEGDLQEEKFFTEQVSPARKLRTKQYADIIKDLIRKRKIKEAIDVLEVRIIKQDKVKPENYIYNLVLGACGRVGFTKKAFMLYNDMKKRGLQVTGGTYTALFNACSNSPWPEDGLTRAKHLRDIMIEKGDHPNETNYNAMIKAFGRCGDLPTAFSIADEMVKNRFAIKDDTINFLLQACITDKIAGFRHLLLVWKKMADKNIRPSLYTFNLMLKCIRECGLGDIESTTDVINKLLENKGNRLTIEAGKLLSLPEKSSEGAEIIKDKMKKSVVLDYNGEEVNMVVQKTNKQGSMESNSVATLVDEEKNKLSGDNDNRPNLLAPIPHLGNIISLSEVTKPEDRLLLVGGCSGFLSIMETYGCRPDIKTFTQLLEAIPNTSAAEKELLSVMKKAGVKRDIDFFNMLIKKRSMRFDYEGAKEILKSMEQIRLRPDVITYGVLALGCKTKEEASELIEEMKKHRYSLNAEILGAMVRQACYHFSFGYVLEMMETCLKENVQPNKKFLEHLVEFKKKCREKMDGKQFSKAQEKAFGIFRARYKTWLQEIQVDESENAHPWQQYRQETQGDVKYKIKDTGRFKARHTSLFKVKTSNKYKKN